MSSVTSDRAADVIIFCNEAYFWNKQKSKLAVKAAERGQTLKEGRLSTAGGDRPAL